MFIKALTKAASRYAPSRALSFDVVHIFKALQLIEDNGHISRALLVKELRLGEGTIKTLIKHLKMQNLIETSKSGTKMTAKGRTICSALVSAVPAETRLPKCSIALGKYNHAVLLRELSFAIRSGIEQRDAAVKMGAIGATTLSFRDNKLVMPFDANKQDSLEKEPNVRKLLIEKLKPDEGDVIIIGSADDSAKTAELAAKNAALVTLVNHEKHD